MKLIKVVLSEEKYVSSSPLVAAGLCCCHCHCCIAAIPTSEEAPKGPVEVPPHREGEG